jgi:hypothetical protein
LLSVNPTPNSIFMKKISAILVGFLLPALSLVAQRSSIPAVSIGTPAWANAHRAQTTHVNVLNGSDTLQTTYQNTACGLNYCQTTVRLGQRPNVNGVPQPAPMPVGVLTPCMTILKAYLYTEILDTISNVNASLTNPNSSTTIYPMTNIGNSVDVCWSMNGTHVWRADVTASISGNGTYIINGIPTSTTITNPDAEGATLIIIYQDATANWEGTLRIDDGCHTAIGVPVGHTMTGLAPCSNSIYGKAFSIMGDIQLTGFTATFNGNPAFAVTPLWWNYIEDANVSITSTQTSTSCSFNNASDCYTLAVAGLYYRTACLSCTPITSSLAVTATSTAATCTANGSATATVTGAAGPIVYNWYPGGQSTAVASALAAGTYTVYVSDGVSCASTTVTVGSSAPQMNLSAQNATCSAGGSASSTVTGGIAPYTYSWSPSGGNAASASGLTAGMYTLSVTDNTGCTVSDSVRVGTSSAVNLYVSSSPDICASNSGSLFAYPSGGTPPYTYNWQPGGQTTATVNNVGAGIYTLTVTDSAGCTATTNDTVTSPAPYFFINNPGPTTLNCMDSLGITISTNMTMTSYTWTPSSSLSYPNTGSPVARPATTTIYTVTSTSVCGTYSDTITVFVDTLNSYAETICFVTVDTSVNKNLVIWERLNSPQNGFYNIYKETSTPGIYALANTQPIQQFSTFTDLASNPSVGADRYELSTVDTCGHESALSPHHRTIFLQAIPAPGSIVLTWSVYEGIAITSYNVYRGPAMNALSLLTTVTGNTYTDVSPPPGQFYMIEAVNPNGPCTPSRLTAAADRSIHSNITGTSPAGILENGIIQNSIHIAPNPGNGLFGLTYQLNSGGKVRLSVVDALGRIVYDALEEHTSGVNTQSLDLSNLSDGVYSLRLISEGGSMTRKLVIQQGR